MSPIALEKAFELYPEVRLIIVAHLYGTPGKMEEIKRIADPLTIRAKLETICHMSKEDRTSMRVKARETAESSFELTGYLSVFETFFDDVQSVVNE